MQFEATEEDGSRRSKFGSIARVAGRLSANGLSPFVVACAAGVLVGVVDLVMSHERGIGGDEPFYEAMAAHPGRAHNFPYAFRVVVPWVVHVLPFSHVVSFTILGIICMAASAGALFALMGEFETPVPLAAWLAIGFVVSPTLLIVIVRHFRSIDPASILVMVLGTLFIVRRQRLALLATLTIGTGVRESALFLIPLAYVVWAQRPIDVRALRDVAVTCLAPALVYIVLRTQIHAVGKQYIPGYSGSFVSARVDLVRSALHGTIEWRRLAYTYGPIWLVAPFALRGLGFARRGLVLVVLCLVSMTYAYDWGRIIFLAAPVFFVAAGWVLRRHPRLAALVVVLLLATDVGYAIYLQVHGIAHGLDTSVSHVPVF